MYDVNKKILWIIEESSHWKQSKLIRQIYSKVKKKIFAYGSKILYISTIIGKLTFFFKKKQRFLTKHKRMNG